MTGKNDLIAALAVMLVLAGCTMGDAGRKDTPSDYVVDAAARVAAADWSRAETVTVALSNFHFMPDKLEFRHDTAYRLHLVNQSRSAHTFTSEGFFRAIAVQKLQSSSGSVAEASTTSIELAAGDQKDLYFVAVRPGTYKLECSELLHDTLGMTGQIAIR
jgi:uncharacterized cupredoxin-like copper-binding protein